MGLFDWLSGRDRDSDVSGPDAAAEVPPVQDGAAAEGRMEENLPDEWSVDDEHHRQTKERMLYPRGRFQGSHIPPQNIAFDHNLQEFAQRVAFICSLENSGKITPDDAHSQIRDLYLELSRTHSGLGISDN